MSDRARCEVFGCRRTFKRDADDPGSVRYICGIHWRMGDKRLRQVASKLKRQGKRFGWSPRMERIYSYIWDRILRAATDQSVGL